MSLEYDGPSRVERDRLQASLDLATRYEWDDETRSWVIKRVGDGIISVSPMAFNHRLLLSRTECWPMTWEAGWCYPSALPAFAAAEVWDPLEQPSPVGWIKCAADSGWRPE